MGAMGTHVLQASLVISCLCVLWICGFASLPPHDLLGISPQDVGYYKAEVIKCKDGGKKFTKLQLNDEFCDCPDGTDEPGTSACPEGKFYCLNAGHIPQTIFSSRVNDGLCDCCDGSDEYNSSVSCPNTCWEAGNAAREKLKKNIAAHQEGLVIRKLEVEKAEEAFAKDEEELLKLKSEKKILKDLVDKLREHKEQIDKAEEEERLRKENEEKKQRDVERKAMEQNKSLDTDDSQDIPWEETRQAKMDASSEAEVLRKSDHSSGIQAPAVDTVSQITGDHGDLSRSGHGFDETNDEGSSQHATEKSSEVPEGLSRDELGRLVACRWTGDHSAKETHGPDEAKEEEDEQGHHSSYIAEEENYETYNSDNDDERVKYDDDDNDDDDDAAYEAEPDEEDEEDEEDEDDDGDPNDSFDTNKDSEYEMSGSASWLDKIQQTVQNVLQAFNFVKSPVNISDASRVRKEYANVSSKLSKLQSRISSLTEKLKQDFGKDKEFYSFYDRCFDIEQNKYVYKICPFKKASQVEGHSTTRLGNWEKFDESYRVMQFSDGERCWNGPDRSMKVRLRCGLKDELSDVDEPSRCEYVAILSTPLLCREDKLKELQQKLDDLTKSQPSFRDEL